MFLQKFSKKMQIYLQILYTQVLMHLVKKFEYPSVLKQTNIVSAFKKGEKESKIVIDQLVFCLMCPSYLKNVFSDKYQVICVPL